MEHISEILRKRQTPTNTSRANTDTWSKGEAEKASPSSNCPICKGVGFVYIDVPVGHTDFGKAMPCRCTREELAKERQARLQHYSNLGSLARLTFDNLLPEGRSGEAANQERFSRAYEAAKAFTVEPKGWLVLSGPSGCGKTHLAAAIVNERINHGYPALFQSVSDLLDHLRSAFSPNSEIAYDELFEQVRNAPLLVLDDLGSQVSTPWAREKLDQLLNHRFNHELPTVITIGVPISELDDRIRTRLTDPRLSQVQVIEEKPTLLPEEYEWGPEFEREKKMTFANFTKRVNLPLEQQENVEKAFQLAFDFAKSPEGWLVFMGVTGCGKTHLAAAIVNYRRQAKQPALFVVVPDFLDHLRSTFSPESKVSYDQLFERVKTTPLLVLDDFGEQSATPWAREKLYQLINYRYNACLPTIITTRYSLQEIYEEIESSISSRLVDPKISNPFNIMAPDYRGDHAPAQGTKMPPRRGKKGRWS